MYREKDIVGEKSVFERMVFYIKENMTRIICMSEYNNRTVQKGYIYHKASPKMNSSHVLAKHLAVSRSEP